MRKALLAALAAILLAAPVRSSEALQEIVVRSGDTLWGIANYYLKDPKRWPELLSYNKELTNDPTVALPGMKLRVPVLLIKEQLRSAELLYMLKDVRFRRKESNEWRQAKLNMELFNQDGLRTMEESAARIRFPTGEIVALNENSLVTIRPEKGQDTVQLLAGDVRARQSRVITAGGARIDPLGADADYRTRVKLDKTELVLVYRGRVDVTAQGKTVRVPEGFGSEIRPLMPPTEPIPLPNMPVVSGAGAEPPKATDAVVRTARAGADLTLEVELPAPSSVSPRDASPSARSVSRSGVLEKFHLQVDDDAEFKTPLLDRYAHVSEKIDLMRLGLPDGTYWWRVAFVDSLGMEGVFSPGQTFSVDLAAPPVTLLEPAEDAELAWEEEFVEVVGETEPGCTVRVEDKGAPVDETGRFRVRLFVHEGKNRIPLVVRDASGNATRVERVVYRLMPGQKARKAGPARPKTARAETDGETSRQGFLASFGAGLLTIGTIIGIVLLIVQ